MSELQKAKEWLKYFKQLKEANLRSYPHRTQDAEAVENCKVLLALIDSEIVRQSATDEQIRTALDYVNDYKKVAMDYDTSVGIFPPTSEEVRAWETVETALRQYQFPSAIQWTGKNLREVIDLIGWNESASSKWTWAEYEQVVKEKGLKIFTPDGSVMAEIGDWIIQNGKGCYVTRHMGKPTVEAVSVAIWYQDSHIQKEECRWRDVSEEDDCEPGARNFHEQYIDAHKLAIQALRQTNVIQDSLQDGKRWCEKVELVEVVTDKG
jgi:hypothetical protein